MLLVARRELSRGFGVAFTAVLSACVAGEARADISPPAGYDWLSHREVEISNLEAFPDWVFVSDRCGPRDLVQEYLVVRPREVLDCTYGTLYALPAREVRTRPVEQWSGPPPAPLRIVEPAIADAKKFFETNPRVVRPGFVLDPWGSTTAKNVGARAVRFRLRVDAVGTGGVKAHFTSARYECKTGAFVEVEWGRDQREPPLPRCPVTDDHGQWVGALEGGVPAPGATSVPGPTEPPADSPRRDRTLWLGVVVTSLSLLGAGLLLREKPKPGGESQP